MHYNFAQAIAQFEWQKMYNFWSGPLVICGMPRAFLATCILTATTTTTTPPTPTAQHQLHNNNSIQIVA